MADKLVPLRNNATGRYTDKSLNKLCICQHPLGDHTITGCAQCICKAFKAIKKVKEEDR